jgi:tetratricopeptide (TPR) repeat protein
VKFAALCLTLVLVGGPAIAEDKLVDSFQSLKDAVGKKDAAQVKVLVGELTPMVKEIAASSAPSSDDEKQAWSDRVAYAKSVGEYCDYALFATAIQSPPAATVDLLAMLEQQNPASKYLDSAYVAYFMALNQTGGAAKIPAIAEKALANFPDNADLLSVLMESSLNAKQSDKALTYSERLIDALGKASKPENVPDADWERKRNASLGRAHWVAGMVQCEKKSYAPGDKELRAALPLIAGNNAMMGPALFNLGMANYELGKTSRNKAKMLEAVKFSQQSAAIAGPFAEQARRNAVVMKADADKLR